MVIKRAPNGRKSAKLYNVPTFSSCENNIRSYNPLKAGALCSDSLAAEYAPGPGSYTNEPRKSNAITKNVKHF